MRTEPKCTPNPKPIYPRFFKKFCQKCKMDFVKEPGWEYTKGYLSGLGVTYRYFRLCKNCAPTQKEAYKYFTGKR